MSRRRDERQRRKIIDADRVRARASFLALVESIDHPDTWTPERKERALDVAPQTLPGVTLLCIYLAEEVAQRLTVAARAMLDAQGMQDAPVDPDLFRLIFPDGEASDPRSRALAMAGRMAMAAIHDDDANRDALAMALLRLSDQTADDERPFAIEVAAAFATMLREVADGSGLRPL